MRTSLMSKSLRNSILIIIILNVILAVFPVLRLFIPIILILGPIILYFKIRRQINNMKDVYSEKYHDYNGQARNADYHSSNTSDYYANGKSYRGQNPNVNNPNQEEILGEVIDVEEID